MSTATIPLRKPHANASTRELRVGTFADGQRAVPVTLTYSAKVGSFGDAARD